MPDHKTKFNPSWLNKSDTDGNSLKTWLKPGSSESTFICTLCRTDELDCGNKGWKAVEQHMMKEKHKRNVNALKKNARLHLSTSDSASSSCSQHTVRLINPIKPLSLEDQVTRAEILWALKSVQHGFSYRSSDETGELFRAMFPDSHIAQKFAIQHSKMSYVISHGLGPFFRGRLIEEIKECQRFVLCFDEQTNNQSKKQLDLLLRYWSSRKGSVVTRYYRSVLLGHAQATIVVDSIFESFRTDGIDIRKILMLSRDNPNVNKTVEKMINDSMKKVDAELMSIGTCNLHIVHNAFKAGMIPLQRLTYLVTYCFPGTNEADWHVENFCMDVWSWFRKSPARQEDFETIVDEINDSIEKSMLYFSSTRWILLGKVIERVLSE